MKNMFYNYVYSQSSYLMEFKCNFQFVPVSTLNLWHSNLQGLVISVHVSFLQLNDIW